MIRSVRARITLISAVVTAVALVSAAWALLTIVRADLVDSARDTLESALESVADDDPATARFQIELDGQIAELGLFNRADEGVASGVLFLDGENEAQVLLDAESGDLLAIVEPVTGVSIDGELADQIESLVFQVYDPAVDGTPAALDASPVLIGATPLDDVDDSIDALERALLIVGPLVVLIVAAASWWLTGRALRPVHAISERVDEISTTGLDQRVPVPDGDDEIAELATVMNEMLERLERGADRTRQFTADASHELRTPLSSVRGAAELIGAGRAPERAAALAGDIVVEADRMNALIDDLLALARLDESELLRRAPVDLGEIVQDVVGSAQPDLDRAVAVFGDADSSVVVTGDAGQLRRLVSNLVDNARRHGEEIARVSIGLDAGEAVLRVDDDGDGVDVDDRERIFDRFTRIDESRRRADGGTGLGLALVRSIAGAHGATVRVSESPEGGARFEVRFPPSA